MEPDAMPLCFARQLPFSPPRGFCARGATALLRPEPVPVVPLKTEAKGGVTKSASQG